uniref:Sulfur carrier protein ThiS n=1 Tax=Candidatus Kentrum sp. TUN TaxID=2126343 RepID=A0A450ZAQ0_9GAMM|nr:MAG: sulfur carrier protein ThiS [Candidatus Kentron sp. TUN]VFK53407.1 MAG: sulfur carrier protein ThiS [Candidatus Kentron sp. TUN]VFK54376.1 MAG: sulfur carrier protein ThiS [Candidatus Kentron sp. TUN]
MNIKLNGKDCELAGSVTIAGLLETHGIIGKRIAVEVNEAVLPRSEHSQYQLRENDCVEIISAIGGG